MFLSRMFLSKLPAIGGLAVATAVLLITAEPAAAQHRGYVAPPSPPPGMSKMWPWNVQGYSQVPSVPTASASANYRTPPASYQVSSSAKTTAWGSVQVVITRPEPAPVYVDIRGPDGQVRSFLLAGGPEVIQSRQVIVHAGETATFRVLASNQGR